MNVESQVALADIPGALEARFARTATGTTSRPSATTRNT
jgi:hypothetical protein